MYMFSITIISELLEDGERNVFGQLIIFNLKPETVFLHSFQNGT